MKKIYIADDEENILNIISSFLISDGYDVTTFMNGDALLLKFKEEPSDLVILDIMMPGTDGLTICNTIRAKYAVPIIIVSAKDSELDRITGISIGADDYLVKPFSPLELLARVKSIFRRVQLDSKKQETTELKYGSITLNIPARKATVNNETVELTSTEFALLSYLIENFEKAVSREELLKNVWKYDADVDTRATDDVLKRLRKKIAQSDVSIVSVWGFGFKLEIKQ